MIVRQVAALLVSACVATSAGGWTVDLGEIEVTPNPRLGLAFPGSQTRYYSAISDAGIGVTRISASWGRIEKSNGRFDWSGLDQRIVALQDEGIEVFVTFESDADWATVPETHGIKNARPEDMALWSRFVGLAVERYDGDGQDDAPGLRQPVRYWQAANEWIGEKNRSGGWVGTADQLIAYISAAEASVKAASSRATFVLGGIAAFNMDILLVARGGSEFDVQQSWSESSETVLRVEDMRGPEIAAIIDGFVMPVLRKSPYDVADVHLYGPEGRDAARIALLRRLSGRPVLSAECGGPSLDYGGTYTPEGHFIAVVDRNLGVLGSGAQFCLWFRLAEGEGATFGNRRTGLYTANAQPKPGVFAYRLLARLLAGGGSVKQKAKGLFIIETAASGPITVGWGAQADGIRADADRSGHDFLCLASAPKGLLMSNREDCAPDAFTLSGRNLANLFDR